MSTKDYDDNLLKKAIELIEKYQIRQKAKQDFKEAHNEREVVIIVPTIEVLDVEFRKGKLRAKIRDTVKEREKAAKMEGAEMKFADGHFRMKKYTGEYTFRHNGEYERVYGKTEKECHLKRLAFITGEREASKAKPKTLKDWLNLWVEQYKKGKVSEQYYKSIIRYINVTCEKLGNIRLNDLKPLELQKYINSIGKDNTRVKIATVLSDSLKKAYAVQLIKHNPFLAVEVDKGETESYKALTPKEQQELLKLIDNKKYRDLFIFCCCTGLRISEALAITEKDIDYEQKLITVNKQKKRNGEITPKLKSKKAHRVVPFIPHLFKLIDINSLNDITYSSAKSYFDRLKKKHPIDFVIHSFRHTFISNCYYAGIRDKQIQIWAGHSKVDTTVNTYTHIFKGSSLFIAYTKLLKREHT